MARSKQAPVKSFFIEGDELMNQYIETLLSQQREYLERPRKRPFQTNSNFVGVPDVVYAVNQEEADAIIDHYEEEFKTDSGVKIGRCHQIIRR